MRVETTPSGGNETLHNCSVIFKVQQQTDSPLCLSPSPLGSGEPETSSPAEEAQHRLLTQGDTCCGATVQRLYITSLSALFPTMHSMTHSHPLLYYLKGNDLF